MVYKSIQNKGFSRQTLMFEGQHGKIKTSDTSLKAQNTMCTAILDRTQVWNFHCFVHFLLEQSWMILTKLYQYKKSIHYKCQPIMHHIVWRIVKNNNAFFPCICVYNSKTYIECNQSRTIHSVWRFIKYQCLPSLYLCIQSQHFTSNAPHIRDLSHKKWAVVSHNKFV